MWTAVRPLKPDNEAADLVADRQTKPDRSRVGTTVRRYNLAPLSTSLFIQAALTAFFTLAPLGGESGSWRAFELLIAAVAAAVGVFLRSGSPQSRNVVLGFEAIAIAVGAIALVSQHMYMPGTIIGIGVLIRVVNLPSQAPAPVMPAAPMPFGQFGGAPCDPATGQPYAPQPYAQPQYSAQPQYGAHPQYGQPQYGAQPQYAPAPYQDAAPMPPAAPTPYAPPPSDRP
jgi:hypothetical protein